MNCPLCKGAGVYENPTAAHIPEPLPCECTHPDNPQPVTKTLTDEITDAFAGAPFGFNA